MHEAHITSTFTSQVAVQGFADVVDAADRMVGTTITAGRARLEIKERNGDGTAGAVWYDGVLRTGSVLVPSVRVDVVATPWSAGRTEIGVRPLSRLGRFDSLRTARFLNAAWAVLPELVAALGAASPVATPARDLQAA
jgi:hypothetical protein